MKILSQVTLRWLGVQTPDPLASYVPAGLGWLRGTVAERRSLTGELSLSCARHVADG